MPVFKFHCSRSTNPADQVDGVVCKAAYFAGSLEAKDAAEATSFLTPSCFLPGVWLLRLTCGERALPARRITVPPVGGRGAAAGSPRRRGA